MDRGPHAATQQNEHTILPSRWALHLDVTRTWGNRTLPTASPEWRALRFQILIRDNRTCASCGYTSPHPGGRAMRVDHSDGDASNNDLENLRIHCPPCEVIRHCGFAGIKGWIVLAASNIDQVEIVRMTREMFERSGVVPAIEAVDPCAVPTDILPEEFANTLLETHWEDLPEERRSLRGFFLPESTELFLATMVKPTPRSASTLDESDLRAMEILAIERSLPWIRYSPAVHESPKRFLDTWPPSTTRQTSVAWICVDNPRLPDDDDSSFDVDALCAAWDEACAKNIASVEELDKLALKFNVLVGKWLVFATSDTVDQVWSKIVRSTLAGTLGTSAKVSPYEDRDPSHKHVICVYTRNYNDRADVNKVRDGLRRLGLKQKIGYKPDIYTYCNIYAKNRWNILPTRYHM